MTDAFSSPMSDDNLAAIRARLDEPPPPIVLVGRNRGLTPIETYLRLLQEDRINLVNEIDRLSADTE